jgi:hypothetical protein
MSRLQDLSSNPTLLNFAKDASQGAIRRIADFIAPRVEVPDITGQYKSYNAANRYKRPVTLRKAGQKATQIGFDATDPSYNLRPHALDFPIPIINGMSDVMQQHHYRYGTQLLADIGGLDHEAEVINAALAAVGAGTNIDLASTSVDPLKELSDDILDVMKLAKNGAGIKVLFGATALNELTNNALVRQRFVSGGGRAAKGAALAMPTLQDISSLLFGNPQCEVSLYVEDSAPEGVAEDIDFMLDNQVLIFASNDQPNTMDASFMKTFVPMSGFMTPGVYRTEDDRDEVLKMDWTLQVITTNAPAAKRRNHAAG